MATTKITEKQTTSTVKDSASVLITQPEDNDVESLRRATLAALVERLRAKGINDGYVLTTVLQAMYPNLVKSITQGTGKITVTYWDNNTQDITVSSGSAYIAETYTVAASAWQSMSGNEPFGYSAEITATHTIGTNTVCELVNDNAVNFAKYGFAIGDNAGQSIKLFAMALPGESVTLEVDYYG